jgi:hypothetical protein
MPLPKVEPPAGKKRGASTYNLPSWHLNDVETQLQIRRSIKQTTEKTKKLEKKTAFLKNAWSLNLKSERAKRKKKVTCRVGRKPPKKAKANVNLDNPKL